MPLKREFRDLDLNFEAHPVTGDVSKNTGEDAIKSSVKNLVLSKFYDHPFKPLKGSKATSFFFENFDPATEDLIEDTINDVIEQYEPRATLLRVESQLVPEQHQINVTITFRILNTPQPVSVDVFLNQVR